MTTSTMKKRRPGWARLWSHSYRLGLAWLIRTAKNGFQPGRKPGFQRLLVPLDPWRYYEMGSVADDQFDGRCLDISSPKLLTSLLQREGSGDWLGIDLFAEEIDAWKAIDPALELEVQDATKLPYPDDTFDHAICISVVEHMGRGNDLDALKEIRRVVRPGGKFNLTSMVAPEGRDVFVGHKIYGDASEATGDGSVFFEHVYSPDEFAEMTRLAGWDTVSTEYAVQSNPQFQDRFYRFAPFSYLIGPWLRFWYPRTISVSDDVAPVMALADGRSAVVNAMLINPSS